MEFLIDKKIQFKVETEHQSLYKWCLNEIEDDGKSSHDLIPWVWRSNFTASTLSVQREFGIEHDLLNDGKKEIRDTTSIRGYLYPGFCSDGVNLEDYTSFRMFGTNRILSRFDLMIIEADEDKEDSCEIWGLPSYETEIDFRNVVRDDSVVITLNLNSKKFNEFVRLIDAKQVDSAFVELGNVDGFYSEWSPSISTDCVSILTNYHVIEGVDGSGVELPKLNSVGKFSITLLSATELKAKINLKGMKAEDFYKQFEDVDEDDGFLNRLGLQEQRIEQNPSMEQKYSYYAKLINSVKTPLWIILIVLILFFIK